MRTKFDRGEEVGGAGSAGPKAEWPVITVGYGEPSSSYAWGSEKWCEVSDVELSTAEHEQLIQTYTACGKN